METVYLPPKGRSLLASRLLLAYVGFATITLSACTGEPVMTSLNKEIVTLDFGPNLVDCVGFIPQKCMLVREEDEHDFTYLYDAIEGFDYESGYNYKLRLQKTPIEKHPADASLSKSPATP
ncbi:MAG: DUF4377 domain-containing protein [Hormoscilla sp. SP5CHS1]|nr:DUF4377 domain-containing protein [Hormoscilla sp. SP12CHS1]MBC6453643.1 DUF4377 domain-containing protein [Hormoscilla sp. SP5CHS1]